MAAYSLLVQAQMDVRAEEKESAAGVQTRLDPLGNE